MLGKKNEIQKILNSMLEPNLILSIEDKNIWSNIKELNLKHYELKFISKKFNNNILCCFDYFPNLMNLDLSYNRIKKIHPNTFSKINHLRIINLSNNLIEKELNLLCLKKLTNLKDLDISNNLLYNFKHSNLKNLFGCIIMKKLEILDFRMKGQKKEYKLSNFDNEIIKKCYPNLKFINGTEILYLKENKKVNKSLNERKKSLNSISPIKNIRKNSVTNIKEIFEKKKIVNSEIKIKDEVNLFKVRENVEINQIKNEDLEIKIFSFKKDFNNAENKENNIIKYI